MPACADTGGFVIPAKAGIQTKRRFVRDSKITGEQKVIFKLTC